MSGKKRSPASNLGERLHELNEFVAGGRPAIQDVIHPAKFREYNPKKTAETVNKIIKGEIRMLPSSKNYNPKGYFPSQEE